ncbi:hypothetical protein [Microbacterium sp. P04]|uniref:hypothetical protein n=1 Tax=Microbacterium sp. P04 TaxID=3366947 RepID=UPI003745E528
MSILKNKASKAALVVGAMGLAVTLAVPTAAQADPNTTGRTYQISGSDTIEAVYNGLTNGYTVGGVARGPFQGTVGSWDAFGSPDPITPKSGGQAVGRPHGSGDGVKALSAAWNPAKDVFTQVVGGVTTNYDLKNGVATGVDSVNDGVREFDFARSSSKPGTPVVSGSANDKLTFVPFARDAVTPVIQDPAGGVNYSSVAGLTIDELNAIFGDGASDSGRITNSAGKVYFSGLELKPVLPQASSGTRTFFLGAIGVTTPASWVTQGVAENDASALTVEGQIAPFSSAQWIAQKNGVGTSTFGGTNGATLRLVSFNNGTTTALAATGTTTLAPNPVVYGSATGIVTAATPLARDTYTVVPTANYTGTLATFVNGLDDATYFSGGTKYVVEDFGFLHLTYGGTTGQFFSNWTN